MLFEPPSDAMLYDALIARDARWDGRAYVGVTTTGIFCRLTCPARKPRRENCRFFESAAACLEASFRPCKRCKPLEHGMEPLVAGLVQALQFAGQGFAVHELQQMQPVSVTHRHH